MLLDLIVFGLGCIALSYLPVLLLALWAGYKAPLP